jgi:hypothetical protein
MTGRSAVHIHGGFSTIIQGGHQVGDARMLDRLDEHARWRGWGTEGHTSIDIDDGRGPLDVGVAHRHARLGGVLGVLRSAEEDDLVRVGDHGDVDADAARAGSHPAVCTCRGTKAG